MTLVDTNVLLDLVTDDPNWSGWSVAQLETASLEGPLLINDVIYAELAVRYERIEALEAFVEEAGLDIRPIPKPALFLAGKVFTQYRKAGGTRTGVLPDFFIGGSRGRATIAAPDARCRSLSQLFPLIEIDSASSRSRRASRNLRWQRRQMVHGFPPLRRAA